MLAGHKSEFRSEFLAPRYWATWLLFLFCGFLAVIPNRARALLGSALAALVRRLPNRRREIARTNLTLCFPELSEVERQRILDDHETLVVHVFLHYGALMFGSPAALCSQFDVEGREHFEAVSASGVNVIALTPHMAALEHAGQWLATQRPALSVVRLHEGNDVLDWIVTRMRTRYGGNVVGHQEGMLPLIRAVRAGRWLYYLPDEDQGAENRVFVPFYGVPKATVPSLGRLADACHAMVLPMASGYSVARGRFWIRFLPAREVHATGEPANDARQVNELLESLIDLDPAQYMWSYKIFRTRPAGGRKVY